MDLVLVGDCAWRVELPNGADPAAVLEALRSLPHVVDVVVTDRHALVRFAPGRPPDDPRPAIASAGRLAPAARGFHVVRLRYDGADLDAVAEEAGLTRAEAIEKHAGRDYLVELIGFLPGFAYLGPVDPALALPRRSTPRLRVPAGAVGIAGGRTGIYPVASPGGWKLVGTAVDFTPFNPMTGALMRLGDRVRFEPVP